jgi:hypothetical protein
LDARCIVLPHCEFEHWILLFKLNDCFYFIDSLNR